MSEASDPILVARIGKPHGLGGEVTVQLHTDAPAERFALGAVLQTEPASRGPLIVRSVRVHQGRYLLGFNGAEDRDAAESLRNTTLFVAAGSGWGHRDAAPADLDPANDSAEEYYEEELVGMSVRLTEGQVIGAVTALHTRAAQDLLEITQTGGTAVLVPFVVQLVPVVDRERREIVIDPPVGLLDAGD